MTNPDYRHYVLVVDRSGSMAKIRAEAQNGIRHFIREQAALPGRATLSLYQFDTVHERVHDFAPLQDALGYELEPRGLTALLDACGTAITEVGGRLAALPEQDRPGRVVVLIATDGRENASAEYAKPAVRELVTRQQRDYGWVFSYVGANVDAFAEAGSIGISASATMGYAATPSGAEGTWAAASAATTRSVGGQSFSYTAQERRGASQ
jgi:uncharacterized protein YegL